MFAALLALGVASPADAAPVVQQVAPRTAGPSVSDDAGDVELYAVILDRKVIADAIPAYREGALLLVPVGELCRLLEIEITIDQRSGTLSGRFPPGTTFSVVAGRLVLAVGGKEIPFARDHLKLAEGDFFLDLNLVSRLLPVDLVVNANEATLTVNARAPLPVQERLARAERADSLRRRDVRPPDYPAMAIPYRLFGGPFIDQTAQLTLDRPSSESGSRLRVDYATHVTADLLWSSFDGYLSGTDKGLWDVRGTLGRKDPGGGLLGPLRATEVAVGSVFNAGMELVMAPASGTGFMVSNFPVQRAAFFDRTALRGSLPDGWSVELYLNGDLIAYQPSRPDGFYEFVDVPVYFGVNVYRLVFYGPVGQKREETRTFSATETLTPAGKLRYGAGVLDPNLRLVSSLPVSNGRWVWLEGEYGLSRSVALSAAAARSDSLAGKSTDYVTAGLRASLGVVFVRGDVAFSGDGGRAFEAGAQTRLRGVGILVQHAELIDYTTDWFRSVGTDIRRRSYLRLDGALRKPLPLRLPLSVELERAERTDGSSALRLNGRTSAYVAGISASNLLTWWHDQNVGTAMDLVTGGLLLSRTRSTYVFRTGVYYTLSPGARIQSGSISFERRFGSGYVVNGGLQRSFSAASTSVQMGLSKNQGRFIFGLQTQYSRPGGLRVMAQTGIGIGRDDAGRWHLSARQMAGSASLVGRAFLDANGNGMIDPADTPLDQVRFLTNGSRTSVATNKTGTVFIPGLSPYQPTPFSVAAETLEDPYWKPAIDGVTVVPRPGRAPVIDIPILVTGEVTGTVFMERNGSRLPAANVRIELVDGDEKVSKSAISAWDGYFTLTEVRPGKYILRVAAENLGRLGATGATTRTAAIGNDGTVIDGLDLVISVETEEAAAEASRLLKK